MTVFMILSCHDSVSFFGAQVVFQHEDGLLQGEEEELGVDRVVTG